MILEQTHNPALLPVDKSNMSSYPNMLTPPSSSEDSPQPVYFVASPNSSSFHAPDNYVQPLIPVFDIVQQPQNMIEPHLMLDISRKASLHFVEQPTDRFRFRYKSEMAGTHGSLTGYNSDKSRKQTYPTVELKNCSGNAIVRCSIYQSNALGRDFMPHAHRLIMKKGKEEHDDPHDLIVGPEDGWRATFHGMGIIHTAKKNLVSELVRKKTQLKKEYIARTEGCVRELTTKEQVEIKGLAEGESKSINLNIVCLRFDAFIKQNDILFPICEPIYSHGINNLKSALTGELKIVRLDHCTSPARGGKEIFVLVERVTKKNIKIRFFELDDKDDEVWSDYGKFNDLDVHHQYAIVFKTPKYKDENITQPVKVFIELVRPTDHAKSEPREFKYIPSNPYRPGSKRPRNDYSSSSYDSSNIGSDELPEVISNLNLEQNVNINVNNTVGNNWMSNISNDLQLTSAELAVAVNNIDSDEFKRLFTQFGDYTSYLSNAIDAPKMASRTTILKQTKGIEYKSMSSMPSSAIKMEVSSEDREMALVTYEELENFCRTNPAPQKAKKFVSHYLGTNYKTNALHVFICLNNFVAVKFLLRLLKWAQELELVNIYNSNSQTPLQLAVLCHNEVLVQKLLEFKAEINRVGMGSLKMNTALHNAVEENVSVELLELLLSDRNHEKAASYINMTNSDGNTALVIAIENKNIMAVKLLCKRGADVNLQNVKNGYTPLRIAIEKQYLDMIKYLLSLPQLNPAIVDFNEVSALTAAHKRESSKEIMEVIEKYMIEHKLEVDIKEEQDEESDEEMEDESDVKSEPITPEELEDLYKKVSGFTPQCLDEVSALLNESGKWEDLAELLDVRHLIRCGLISTELNPSKNLLTFAIETNNDTMWEVRNFLENLDEIRAVEIIDKMVRGSR